MIIFAIIRSTRFFILDEHGFEDYEKESTDSDANAFYNIESAREHIIKKLESEWAQLDARGMELRCDTSLQNAKIRIRTGLITRLVFHDPNGQDGNLYEIEYKIKRLSLIE